MNSYLTMMPNQCMCSYGHKRLIQEYWHYSLNDVKFIDTVVHRLIIIVKLLFNFAPADIGLREEVKDPGKERWVS